MQEESDLCSDLSDPEVSSKSKSSPDKKCSSHGLKYRHRRRRERRSSSSTASDRDSSYLGTRNSVPSSTRHWDINVLERLGIYYNSHFYSSPLDVLDMIYHKTEMFGPLSNEQMEYVKSLQDSVTYNCSITELLGVKNMLNVDTFIPGMKKDIANIRNKQSNSYHFTSAVEDFITNTRLMIKYQVAHLTQDYRKDPVPKDVFVDMFKVFVKMCQLLPLPGSVCKSDMCIHGIDVKSESDVLVMTKDHLDNDSPETVSVVSVVEILYRKEKQTKTKSSKSVTCSATESFDNEPSAQQEPAIFDKIGPRVLGQHGGELLLHHGLYGKKLSKGKAFKYLPGMIVIGTEITFTVLTLNGDHVRELETKCMSSRNKAYIYYSEPKDLLKKEDRDLLMESFVRLSN